MEFVHEEGNNVSLKFGQPSLVYQETNQEIENNFRTPKCIFNGPTTSRKSCLGKPLNKNPSKKPVIKLQKTASSIHLGSLESNPSIQLNTMNFEEAKDFDELESIIKGQTDPSKIEAQPILLRMTGVNGDEEEDNTAKSKITFKTLVFYPTYNTFQKKGQSL